MNSKPHLTGEKNMSEQNPNPEQKTFTEQIEVTGNQLVERFKALLEEGNVRRVIIRDGEGKTLLEIPLTVGAVIGGALALFNPWLAALGAIGGLVAKLTIEVVREEPENIEGEAKAKVDDATERLSGE
jgi:hypothetical protein